MLNFPHLWNKFLYKILNSKKTFDNEPIFYQLEIGSLSDKGCSRPANQDYIGMIQSPDDSGFVAVVADGMGGHQAGDIASRLAVEEIRSGFFTQLKKKTPQQALRQVFEKANSVVFTRAQQSLEYQGMGTTLVVLAFYESAAYFAHTGDSRLYLMRKNEIHQLSHDHTLVAEMLKQGLIDVEQAENHPDKHIITHAVGTKGTVFVDVSDVPIPLQFGDYFLLCSDGLYDLVSDTEILHQVTNSPAQQACQELVQLANSRGGYDNISAIIIKILEASSINKEIPITRVSSQDI